jgi:putative N6-adenine-specific DNA methylase
MRETLAALLLRACGYQRGEPLIDPMCGSGTFPIEAAEMSLGLPPGRSRSFAFETLASFDPQAYAAQRPETNASQQAQVFGFDRDQGAIGMSRKNAERAGVQIDWRCQPISEMSPPCDAPGLVFVNPPYGGRIGNKKMLYGLYAALGERMRQMPGWRLGMVTSDKSLARATGLAFSDVSAPIPNGGLKIQLYQTAPSG